MSHTHTHTHTCGLTEVTIGLITVPLINDADFQGSQTFSLVLPTIPTKKMRGEFTST